MNSEKAKTHVVLDLEMCGVPKAARKREYPYKHEIIQIGAVLLDEDYAEISRFSTYVKPQYGFIDWFIADLTGIHDSHIKHAPELTEALQMLMGWLSTRDIEVFTWSNTDYLQFDREIRSKGINLEGLEEFMDQGKWHDYQKTFGHRFDMQRDVALKEAMDLIDIDQEGRAHDGLEDAHNTGRLIAKLEKNPDLQLPKVFREARKEEVSRLSFSMGNLFSGLTLDLPA